KKQLAKFLDFDESKPNAAVMVNEAADASALGAAFIGMKAIGEVKNITDAKMFLKNVKIFKPDAGQHHIYKKYFKIYKSLYKKLKDTFSDLSMITNE
ncbi:MAG TPA: hypothetical protein VGG71_16215, partial [Chitinophagaceae bacterium]